MLDRSWKTFIAVAQTRSLSRAAERLFLTPAAVMKQMNALEERLGLRLLERSNRGVKLTEAGEYLLGEALRLSSRADGALERARELERRGARSVRVGSSFLNPAQKLVDLWSRVGTADIGVRIVPYSDERGRILDVVASLGRELDFMCGVFGSRLMFERAGFLELGRLALCVAVPKGHRLAGRERLSLADLAGERLIMCRRGDAEQLDAPRAELERSCPGLTVVDTDFFYDLDTFNEAALSGSLLLSFEMWSGVHPALVTLPLDWDYTVSYGLLHAPDISGAPAEFAARLREALRGAGEK